jgi:hypothetical protein
MLQAEWQAEQERVETMALLSPAEAQRQKDRWVALPLLLLLGAAAAAAVSGCAHPAVCSPCGRIMWTQHLVLFSVMPCCICSQSTLNPHARDTLLLSVHPKPCCYLNPRAAISFMYQKPPGLDAALARDKEAADKAKVHTVL